MQQIRFDQILSTDGGQDDAFEELICQIGRRVPPDGAEEFRRVRGAGGDGGVEAYWRLQDGSEVGYQAKFFLESGKIGWSAIDKSVATALRIHPKLTKYIIAIACDLTDRTGRSKRGGLTGWEHWEQHKASWRQLALKQLGREVEFVPWPASEVRDVLATSAMTGLAARWFGQLSLKPEWLSERVNFAIADLEERYHPEDHVAVGVEHLFGVLGRGETCLQHAREMLAAVRTASQLCFEDDSRTVTGALSRSATRAARRAIDCVLAVESRLDCPAWVPWDATAWSELVRRALSEVSALHTQLRNTFGTSLDVQRTLRAARGKYTHLLRVLEDIRTAWSGTAFRAEHERVVLLSGRSGAGKSHLLANQARHAVSKGRPVVLVLGQQLASGAIWPQILSRLGVQGNESEFLGALDSAAEAAGQRAFVLVDAVNEGPGADIWRNGIASFVAAIRPFKNIACVLSCRSEYWSYVLPKSVAQGWPSLEVRGFQTIAEQQAAASVFLDRRGIARPAAPWFAEEFRNPLFLRSVCEALRMEGKSEFPRGLVGIKTILNFYLASVARTMSPTYQGSDELFAPLYSALSELAGGMAASRRDYLPRVPATEVCSSAFTSFESPVGRSWLEIMQRSGLLRFDPDPTVDADHDGPIPPKIDVVRFSFQRFQDQLMGEALLRGVQNPSRAFSRRGPLRFLADEGQWATIGPGLIGALAIQIPERFGRELVDLMPGGWAHWRSSAAMRTAFEGSLHLRTTDAFSQRTAELFALWIADGAAAVSLLLQLSIIPEHPWNADGMHARLCGMSMPERDGRWTVAVNEVNIDDVSHGLTMLIRWCASAEARSVIDRSRELAALALAWCLTSSNRPVRDRVTKALTHLMLVQSDLLSTLVASMKDVDDLYVHERIWAAAFGACTHDPRPDRMRAYAREAWRSVFAVAPPKDLLLRDYARGIIDLAVHVGADVQGIDTSRCRPPFADAMPNLPEAAPFTSAVRDKLTDGADAIVSSCLYMGDFGDYEIKPAVRDITTVLLGQQPMATKESAFRHFKTEVLGEDMERVAAFYELETHVRRMGMPDPHEVDLKYLFSSRAPNPLELEEEARLRGRFVDLLAPEEKQLFEEEAIPWLDDSWSALVDRVDPERCRVWVARRAIDIGGGAVDLRGRQSSDRSERPAVERLGKKYQWQALSELLCGLTSHYCLELGYQEDRSLRPYDLPLDLGFTRDIDPTVLRADQVGSMNKHDSWMFGEQIVLDTVSEKELSTWPVRGDPTAGFDRNVERHDANNARWFVLHDHMARMDRYTSKPSGHGMRQQEFRRIFSVFVESARLPELVAHLEKESDVSVSHWEVTALTDEPYLGEILWRRTAPQQKWSDQGAIVPPTVRLAYPLYRYVWEAHLDLGLDDGARAYLPAGWLARQLDLNVLPDAGDVLSDSSGRPLVARKATADDSVVLLHADAVERLEREAGLSCVWLLVAERNAWLGGSNEAASWRRAEGIAWLQNGRIFSKTWKRDGSHAELLARRKAGIPGRDRK